MCILSCLQIAFLSMFYSYYGFLSICSALYDGKLHVLFLLLGAWTSSKNKKNYDARDIILCPLITMRLFQHRYILKLPSKSLDHLDLLFHFLPYYISLPTPIPHNFQKHQIKSMYTSFSSRLHYTH